MSAVGGESAPTLDAENPWPGLASFREQDRAFFRGRDAEIIELHRRARRSRLTVLYGISGMGKTSLLQAGLFPLLRAEGGLPVLIRFVLTEDEASLRDQVRSSLAQAVADAGAEAPPMDPLGTLWEDLHRRTGSIWGPTNRLLSPVFVFDQFEELFTLEGRSERRDAFLDELADLVEGRPPAQVTRRLDENPAEAAEYDFERHRYDILLSLREDFLPDLDETLSRLGLVARNRLRLRRMGGLAALQVVNQAEALVTPELAEQVVRYVARSDRGVPLDESVVEPALLSQVCRELNNRRKQHEETRITPDLLELSPEEMLGDFYERSLDDLPIELREYVERELVTVRGFRDSRALENALSEPGVTREGIDTLVARRLLRIDRQGNRQRIELTHDLLVGVVKGAAERRRLRENEAAVLQQGKRVGTIRALVVAVPLMLLAFFAWQWVSNGALAGRAVQVSQRVTALSDAEGVPRPEALAALDTLRVITNLLRAREAVWWRVSSGSYVQAKADYFRGFGHLLLDPTLDGIVQDLERLGVSGAPDDYEGGYARLRLYLTLTQSPENADGRLAKDLVALIPFTLDAAQTSVAERQFAFYAQVLPQENPYPLVADARLVERTRGFLSQMTSAQAAYARALQAVSSHIPPIAPPDIDWIQVPGTVAGVFTGSARQEVRDSLANGGPGGAIWVLGDTARTSALLARYDADYRSSWMNVLSAARLAVRPETPQAAGELARGFPDALLAFLGWVASHQRPEDLAGYYQPLMLLLSQDTGGRGVWSFSPGAQPYVASLMAVGQAADALAAGDPKGAAARFLGRVQEGRIAARALAPQFRPEQDDVGFLLVRLLESPFRSMEGLAVDGAVVVRPPEPGAHPN